MNFRKREPRNESPIAEPITEAVPVAIAVPICRARAPGIITPYTEANSVAILLNVPVTPTTSNGGGSRFHAPPTTEYFITILSARCSSSSHSCCMRRILSRPDHALERHQPGQQD